jgi:hypothetical protein
LFRAEGTGVRVDTHACVRCTKNTVEQPEPRVETKPDPASVTEKA